MVSRHTRPVHSHCHHQTVSDVGEEVVRPAAAFEDGHDFAGGDGDAAQKMRRRQRLPAAAAAAWLSWLPMMSALTRERGDDVTSQT